VVFAIRVIIVIFINNVLEPTTECNDYNILFLRVYFFLAQTTQECGARRAVRTIDWPQGQSQRRETGPQPSRTI